MLFWRFPSPVCARRICLSWRKHYHIAIVLYNKKPGAEAPGLFPVISRGCICSWTFQHDRRGWSSSLRRWRTDGMLSIRKCYHMRKLLYIPCNQDGFLPSCSSLPFLSGLQPADIFSYFAAKTFTALILYHKPATKASRIFAKSISAICSVTSHRQFTCGKRRTHIFYPCLADPISFCKTSHLYIFCQR